MPISRHATGALPRPGAWRARGRRLLPALAAAAALLGAACGEGPPKDGAKGFRAEPASLVRDLEVATGREYVWVPFRREFPVYMDRTYLYGGVPEEYLGYPALLTANDDKFSPAEQTLISFTAVVPLRVFVLYSTYRGRLGEEWLNDRRGWVKEPWSVGTTLDPEKAVRNVRSRLFGKDERVEIAGAGCTDQDCDNYTLVVVPQ